MINIRSFFIVYFIKSTCSLFCCICCLNLYYLLCCEMHLHYLCMFFFILLLIFTFVCSFFFSPGAFSFKLASFTIVYFMFFFAHFFSVLNAHPVSCIIVFDYLQRRKFFWKVWYPAWWFFKQYLSSYHNSLIQLIIYI